MQIRNNSKINEQLRVLQQADLIVNQTRDEKKNV